MAGLKVISLGWGVQSWTMAAMVALGELPMVDFVIHSDTTWERENTYSFAKAMTPWLEEHGVKYETTSDEDQAQTVTTLKTDIPAFTLDDNGSRGQLRRQCTGRWKIAPIRRHIAAELESRGLKKTPGVVEQWLGITTDEFHRAKDSDVKYIKHRFPLLDLGMSRGDCRQWLAKNNLPIPGKSACVFCPYHNRTAWEEMKREGGSDWEIALNVDSKIRNARPPYPLFVHSARVPLGEAVNIPEDDGYEQLMFDIPDDECDSGFCFL